MAQPALSRSMPTYSRPLTTDPHRETLADRIATVAVQVAKGLDDAVADRESYYSPPFHFARGLASHKSLWRPECRNLQYADSHRLPSHLALPIIESALAELGYSGGLADVILAEDCYGNELEPCIDFLRHWDSEITTPSDLDLPSKAFDLSSRATITLPELSMPAFAGYRRWLEWIRCMQLLAGDTSIYLSTEKVCKTLHCAPATVSTFRAMARNKGYITTTKAHVPRQSAEEFRVAVELLPVAAIGVDLEV